MKGTRCGLTSPVPWLRCFGSLVKADPKTMKAMQTPAAKAKGVKPETKTMKVIKTPAAKAKGMKPKTKPLAGMKTPAANAKEMKPDRETVIIINGAIRLTTPMSPFEILRCLLPHTTTGEITTKGGEIAEDELLALLE